MAPAPNRRLDDVRDLRAMAHPLRVRLYYALHALEAATASRLGTSVGESPALVSYHLRQLRDHGFVEEAPDLGTDRRERWWRPATDGFRFSARDAGGAPETLAAADALQRVALAHHVERVESFRVEEPAWGPEWSAAAFSCDLVLRLTPAELAEAHEEIQAVLRRWRERGCAADSAGAGTGAAEADPSTGEEATAGREHVFVALHGVPFRP